MWYLPNHFPSNSDSATSSSHFPHTLTTITLDTGQDSILLGAYSALQELLSRNHRRRSVCRTGILRHAVEAVGVVSATPLSRSTSRTQSCEETDCGVFLGFVDFGQC